MQLGQTMRDPTSKLLQAGWSLLLGFLLPWRETVFVLWETTRKIRSPVLRLSRQTNGRHIKPVRLGSM